MDFKYWRPFVLFLARTDAANGAYVPQDGMLHLVCQLMKRGKGLSIVSGVLEGALEDNINILEVSRSVED